MEDERRVHKESMLAITFLFKSLKSVYTKEEKVLECPVSRLKTLLPLHCGLT